MKHDIKRGRLEAFPRFTENVGFNAVTRVRIVDPLKQHYTWYAYDDQGRQSTMRSIVVDGGFGVGAQPVLPAELANIPNDPATSVTLAPDEQFIHNERNELVSTILTGPVKRVNRTYNQRGWVTSITAKDELPFNPKPPEFQQHLEYNAAGLIKGQCWVRSGATAGETYIYDELQRLKSYTGSNGTNAYDYDLVGNRLSDLTGGTARVYAHGGAALQPNALVSVTGATHNAQFTYDAHGALTLRSMKEFTPQSATSKIEEFSYDASGLIERYQVRKAAGQGGQSVECAPDASMSPRSDWRYRFGPMKEREQKRLYFSDQGPNAPLPWVYYLISPSKQQLAVYNGVEGKPCGGALGNVYMWPVEYNAYGVGGGRVITRPDNTKHFVVTDHLGSVRLTYDEQGGVLETADYEPFGALATKTGEEARTGYIGRETDNESNLGFNGVRLYDQQFGRFLSTDAMWEKYRDDQAFHYADNCPISRKDENGYWVNLVVGAAIGAAVDVAMQMAVEGKGLSEVNGARVFTAAVAGAATSGVSAFAQSVAQEVAVVATMSATQSVVNDMYDKDPARRELSNIAHHAARNGMIGAVSVPVARYLASSSQTSDKAKLLINDLDRAQRIQNGGRDRPAQQEKIDLLTMKVSKIGKGPLAIGSVNLWQGVTENLVEKKSQNKKAQ